MARRTALPEDQQQSTPELLAQLRVQIHTKVKSAMQSHEAADVQHALLETVQALEDSLKE